MAEKTSLANTGEEVRRNNWGDRRGLDGRTPGEKIGATSAKSVWALGHEKREQGQHVKEQRAGWKKPETLQLQILKTMGEIKVGGGPEGVWRR